MVDEVQREIERIREYIVNGRLTQFDEANTKATAIEPILRELGWDVVDPDEVRREHSVGNRSVDYALFCDDTLKVFIEAKNGGEQLESHQRQLLDYAFAEGVEIAILTNGSTWWFYLPIRAVSWERRKVVTLELNQQDNTEIAQKLVDVLSKETVCSGRAIRNAERHQVLETLPDVWNRLVSESRSSLVNLLAERTHRLCVREPDRDEVEQFLSEHIDQIKITSSVIAPPTPDSPTKSEPCNSVTTTRPRSLTSDPDLTHMKPTSFTFNGNPHRVESWSMMLVRLCELVREVHQSQFDEVLGLGGPQGEIWFTRNKGDLDNKGPHLIQRTNIYVRTHGGGNKIVERAEKLIAHFEDNFNNFGYSAHREGEPPIRVRMR